MRPAGGAPGQAHGVEHLTSAVISGRAGPALQPERQGDVLLQGEVRQDVEGLEDETQFVPPPAGQPGFVEPAKVFAIEHDLAAIRPVEAGDEVEQRGFAHPGLADNGHVLPFGQTQRGAVQRRATVETARQVGDLKHVRTDISPDRIVRR